MLGFMKKNTYKVGEFGERPWGCWKVDEVGDGFTKKTITVNVGGCLSLQSHEHRSEKWEIVEGVAEVTVNDSVKLLSAGEIVEIPLKAIHRLKNAGDVVLIVKETQTGDILDESDIVRYEDVYSRNKTVFVADMDGTLTPARLPMTEEFAEFFEKFIEKHTFFVVSGSDIKKVREQMPEHLIGKISGLYCSMGNEFYLKNELIYKNEFNPDNSLIEKLEKYRRETKYPGKLFDNYIEKRPGMVNFSVLGRNCPQQERSLYKQWDDQNKERRRIAAELSEIYPDYDISVGGNISIDIVPHGFGKEQVAEKLRATHKYEKIVFIGDRTEKGGNDYSLAQELKKLGNSEIVAVNGPDDTLEFLRRSM